MKKQTGQSLIEALIALAAAAVIVSAITVASITAINNSDYSKYQNLATHYAEQGLEILRQEAQSDWYKHFGVAIGTPGKDYCLAQDSIDLTGNPPACGKNIKNEKGTAFFVRQVNLLAVPYQAPVPPNDFTPCNGGVIAAVSVAWNDGKCTTDVNSTNYYCHRVALNSCFTNVNGIPAP
jgi:hypothetical protein